MMVYACGVVVKQNAYKFLARNLDGERPFGRMRQRLVDNTKVDQKQNGKV
jgi:hypothetical protein